MHRLSRLRLVIVVVLVAALGVLAGCSFGGDDDEPSNDRPLNPLTVTGADESIGSDVAGPVVINQQGKGPAQFTADWPRGVKYVQFGVTCSPVVNEFTLKWGKSGYGTSCERRQVGANATIPTASVGSDHTVRVPFPKDVAWWIVGVAVPDPAVG